MKQFILALVLTVVSTGVAIAVNPIREGNMISGHVIVEGSEENIPYATILIVGTGQGTISNEEGQFQFKNLSPGKYKLRVSAVGYKTQEKEIEVSKEYTAVVHFQMIEESFMTDEVVVSANRNEVSRKAAPVVVNVMSTKLFEMVNSTDLGQDFELSVGTSCGKQLPELWLSSSTYQWTGRSVLANPDQQPSYYQRIEWRIWLGTNSCEYDRTCRGGTWWRFRSFRCQCGRRNH